MPLTQMLDPNSESNRGGICNGEPHSSVSSMSRVTVIKQNDRKNSTQLIYILQSKGSQQQISRSLSVPVNNKDRSKLKRSDSFFRVILSTPCVREGDAIAQVSPDDADHGKIHDFHFLKFLSVRDS